MKEYFQIFSKRLFNVKTENLIYRNYCGMNTSHLHLSWVNVEGSNHAQKSPPNPISLVINVITSYDELSADAIVVDDLECAV